LDFEIVSKISDNKTIAIGRSIREIQRLERIHGKGRWRKKKGLATIKLKDGTLCQAEIHWYESSGIGMREMKIKRILEWLW